MEKIKKQEKDYLIELLKSVLFSSTPPEKPEEIEFKKIYKLAKKHFLANMVYYAISNLEKKPEKELLTLWQEDYLIGKMRNTVQASELKIIEGKFQECKIKNVLLKGFALKEVYPSLDMRQMSDLDILIPLEKREEVKSILEALGYEAIEFGKGKDDVYYKKPIMNLEIHNNLFDKSDERMYNYFSKMSSMEKAKKRSEYVYEFSKEDTLIYGIVHLVKHFKLSGIGIRHIIDWWLYSEKNRESLDWEYITNSLKKLELYHFYENIMFLGDVWFKDKESNEVIMELEEYIIDSGIYGKVENRYTNTVLESKRKTIMKLIFPQYNIMCERYPKLLKNRYLLPYYYLVRILEIIFYRREGKGKLLKNIVSEKKENIDRRKALYKNMGL